MHPVVVLMVVLVGVRANPIWSLRFVPAATVNAAGDGGRTPLHMAISGVTKLVSERVGGGGGGDGIFL